MPVNYEWIVEEVDPDDEDQDIIDTIAYPTAEEAIAHKRNDPTRLRIALCRSHYRDNGSFSRSWAYIKNGAVPEIMRDAMGLWEANTPKQYIKEWERAQ